ncbi:MAG TPA: carboxypeptidase-like regulatory domain-containing protein [Pantanalinema sp.]
MKYNQIALALLVAIGLTGCGMPSTGTTARSIAASSPSADISRAESVQLQSLNDNGELDELDDEALQELDAEEVGEVQASGLFSRGSSKIGYVRSTEDGKFYLQTKQGIWKKKDISIPLVTATDTVSLKLSKYLNAKVLVRGATASGTMTVKKAYRVPDLSIVIDLLRTGTVSGKLYNAKTLVALEDAAVTVRSVNTGNIYRATTSSSGKYRVGRLTAGDYTVEATLGGFSKGVLAKVTIAKRKTTSANLPLAPIETAF